MSDEDALLPRVAKASVCPKRGGVALSINNGPPLLLDYRQSRLLASNLISAAFPAPVPPRQPIATHERFSEAFEAWVPLVALHGLALDRERDPAHVADLAHAFVRWLDGGSALPPIELEVLDGETRIADGNHRLMAARRLGLPFIRVRWRLLERR